MTTRKTSGPAETTATEPRWYIVHTYSGHEDRVKKNLEQRVQTMDVKHKIFEVVVPTEEVIEIKEGQRKPVQRKMYAGYLLVKMVMDDESWFVVRNTPGVTGFISAEDEREKRPKPVPLEQAEVDRILRQMASETPRCVLDSKRAIRSVSRMGRSQTSWDRSTLSMRSAARCASSFRSSAGRPRSTSIFFRSRRRSPVECGAG